MRVFSEILTNMSKKKKKKKKTGQNKIKKHRRKLSLT